MYFRFNNWPFWFLMVCKNINKPTNGKLSDHINYLIEGDKGDMHYFRSLLKDAKHVLIITGAGLSQPSGIPTLHDSGTMWRKQKVEDICRMEAFQNNTSNVWEYFHYFRELCRDKKPNKAHFAIAKFQKRMIQLKRNVTLVTINIDGLHQKAGSPSVVEFHGNTFETLCMTCNNLELNMDKPICPALEGREKFFGKKNIPPPIPGNDLPRCKFRNCRGLLRPNVIWFGEDIHKDALDKANDVVEKCDLCLVIGTSSKIYPTAAYGPKLQSNGIPVAEFNRKKTQFTFNFRFHFNGSCVDTVTEALAPFEDEEDYSSSSSESSIHYP